MNWIDPILLAIVALFGLRGYFKGLFREVFSLAGLALGFLSAVRYDEAAAALAASYWKMSPLVLKGAAFVSIFFVVYFLLNLVGWFLHQSEKLLFLQSMNRIGGVVIGIGKGVALTALLVLFIGSSSWLPDFTRSKLEESHLAAPLTRLAAQLIRVGREKLFPKEGGDAVGPGSFSSNL